MIITEIGIKKCWESGCGMSNLTLFHWIRTMKTEKFAVCSQKLKKVAAYDQKGKKLQLMVQVEIYNFFRALLTNDYSKPVLLKIKIVSLLLKSIKKWKYPNFNAKYFIYVLLETHNYIILN